MMTEFKEEKETKMLRMVFQSERLQPPRFTYSNVIVFHVVTVRHIYHQPLTAYNTGFNP